MVISVGKGFVCHAHRAQNPAKRVDVLPAFERGGELAMVDNVARESGGVVVFDPSISEIPKDDLGKGIGLEPGGGKATAAGGEVVDKDVARSLVARY